MSSPIPPSCQPDGIGGYLQEMLYLVVANTILWCMVVGIATKTFCAMQSSKTIYAPGMRRILFVFVVIMTLISTASLAVMLHYTHQLFFSPSQGGLNAHRRLETIISASTSITLPLAIFGADAFMVWRCWILYEGAHHVIKSALFFLLVLLLAVSLATAVWLFKPLITIQILVLPTFGATLIVNILVSILIITRLLNHEHSMKKATGMYQRSSPFRKVIMICVESCSLIIICALFGLGVAWRDSSLHLLAVPLTFLPHVSAIAAFLIILRVANGRTLSTTKQTFAFGDSVGPNNRSQELTALQFAPAVSIISAQEPSPIPSEETDFGGAVIASHAEAV